MVEEKTRETELIEEYSVAIRERGEVHDREGIKSPAYHRATIRFCKARIALCEYWLETEGQ